jgi:caa(3)-type oxidase subunit IV
MTEAEVAINEEEAARVKEHVRVYVLVFVALAALTIVTVAISYLHLPTPWAISLAMVVATVKSGLVACYFMHLISEKKVIIWLLMLCAAFVFSVFAGPLGTETGIGPLWPLPN